MAAIAENYGLKVIRISKEWGQAVKPEEIRDILEKDINREIKGVCLPQNETTSGITNDIEGVSKVIKELGHPTALIVDAVSSLACLPFETDSWNVDVAISASQKGFMLPPGMGMAAVSSKAWSLIESSRMPRWYWDYKAVKEKMKENQFPYTPATTLLFGLKESLKMISEEGIENVWQRHEIMGTAVRNALKAMGLTLFAEEGYQSNTVTAVSMPGNIRYKALAELLRTKYGVVIGGGLSKLQGKIFRIGHLGSVSNMDAYAVMGAVEMALYELGYKVDLGTAAKAVAETLLK